MAAVAAIIVRPRRQPKVFRERDLYTTMNEREVRERYRFDKVGVDYITGLVEHRLHRETRRNHALTPLVQVLLTLRFLATGNFLQTLGDSLGLDKCTTSRVVHSVVGALVELKGQFIVWPQSREEKARIKSAFRQKRGFPNIIGCIDGTHIRIQQPRGNKRPYMNRKHFASLNVMAVCDHQDKITFINAAWPGSDHDSIVFRNSILYDFLEERNKDLEDGVLLGDSGYGCTNYLITPYRVPNGRAQNRYQAAHTATRSAIERTFGQLKRRFGVLHGEVRMRPARTSNIVVACAVLHNIAKNLKEPDLPGIIPNPQQQPDPEPYEGPDDGQAIRDYIARAYFA